MVFTAVSIATTLVGDKYVADFDIHGHTHRHSQRHHYNRYLPLDFIDEDGTVALSRVPISKYNTCMCRQQIIVR